MTNRVALLLSTALSLGACKSPEPSTQPVSSPDLAVVDFAEPTLVPGVKAVADDQGLLDGPTQTSFRIGSMRDLLIRFQQKSVPSGLLWMTMTLTTPQGQLYSTRHVAFSDDPSVKLVPLPEAPDHMVDVSPVKKILGGVALDSYFLVGGTALPNQAPEGVWTLNVSIDGSTALAAQMPLNFGMTL